MSKSLILAVLSKLWNLFGFFILTPLYMIQYSKHEYSLIVLFIVIQSIAQISDAGFSFATAKIIIKNKNYNQTKDTITFLAYLLGIVSLFVLLMLYLFNNNFNALSLMAVAKTTFACVLFVLINYMLSIVNASFLFKTASTITLVHSIIRNVLPLLLFINGPTYNDFIDVQIYTNLLIFIVCIYYVRRIHGDLLLFKKINIQYNLIKEHALPIGIVSVASVINLQIDKLIISELTGLEDLKYYFLLFNYCMINYFVFLSVNQIVQNVFISAYSKKVKLNILINYFGSMSFIFSILISLALYNNHAFLIKAWIDISLSNDQSTLVNLLLTGTFFLVIQMLQYNILISGSNYNPSIKLAKFTFIFTPFSNYFLISNFGKIGAGLSWFILNLLGLLYLNYYLYMNNRDLFNHIINSYISSLKYIFIALLAMIITNMLNLDEMYEFASNVSILFIIFVYVNIKNKEVVKQIYAN